MSATKSKKPEHCYGRYRTLARSLGARLYGSAEGRLYLVGGAPQFDKLLDRLTTIREPPPPARAPTPTDLGFPVFCDGEMSTHALNVRGRSLKRWSLGLRDELKRRPSGKRQRRRLDAEHREIETLRQRMLLGFEWLRKGRDCAAATPYLLDDAQQAALDRLLQKTQADGRLGDLACWFARLVYWIAGRVAAERYLHALSPLLRAGDENEQSEKIRKLAQQLRIFKKRSQQERWSALRPELREAIAALPAHLAAMGKFSTRLRGRSIAEHCDLLVERCADLRDHFQIIPRQRICAWMAALAMCDRASAPLPRRIVENCLTSGNVNHLRSEVYSLSSQLGKPGYDRFLQVFERLDPPAECDEYKEICAALGVGEAIDNIHWARRHDLLHWISLPDITVSWVRRTLDAFAKRGFTFDKTDQYALLDAIKQQRDAKLVDRLLHWLAIPQARAFTPKVLKSAWKALFDLILPGLSIDDGHGNLHRWLDAGESSRRVPRKDGHTETLIDVWLERIAQYQQLAGNDPSIPKSLRREIDRMKKRRNELDYLRREAPRQRMNKSLAARLRHLESSADSAQRSRSRQVQRAAEEVYLFTALEALRTVLCRAAEDACKSLLGRDAGPMSLQRLTRLARWGESMDDSQRKMLRQVVKAWRRRGPGYKAHLPANRQWLSKAADHGIAMSAWLVGAPAETIVDGRRVTIDVADDPLEVFRMGDYFNTCLSLGNCNEMSVLANAHDANKQVVFMRDAQGRVRARQLVAISSEFKLLGFHCYSGVNNKHTELRDQYIDAMAVYCGRWARRCGIALANSGAPESLGEHFWYDDGCWEWREAGKAAWDDAARMTRAPIDTRQMVFDAAVNSCA